jgi:GAF domain/Sel1 repeat
MSVMQPARRSAENSVGPLFAKRSEPDIRVRDSLRGLNASFDQIVERALNSTGASGAALAILQDHEMVCVASAGSDVPPLGSRLQTESGFSGQCIRFRQILRCDDTESDPRVHRETCRALAIRSILAAPVVENESVTGILEVFSPAPYAFTATDEHVLELLANNLSIARSYNSRSPEPDYTSSEQVRRNSSGSLFMGPGYESVAPNQSPASKFYKILPGFACLVIAIAGLLMAGRMRDWFATLPPTHSDVQVATQQANGFPAAPAGENDFAQIRKLAEQGDPAAQFALGARYATGDDVQQDYSQAVRWFSKAAEQGHVLSQATLGAYYWAGRGVPIDLNRAYFWSILAQLGGDQASEYRINILNSRLPSTQILSIKQEANVWLTRHRQPAQNQLTIR